MGSMSETAAEHSVRTIDVTRTYHMGDTEIHALQGVSVSIARG